MWIRKKNFLWWDLNLHLISWKAVWHRCSFYWFCYNKFMVVKQRQIWSHAVKPFSPLHHLVFHDIFVYYIIVVDIIVFKLKVLLFSLLILFSFSFRLMSLFISMAKLQHSISFPGYGIQIQVSQEIRDYIFISNSSCLLSKW